jgi:uncharacterized protein YhhL (DUF1145 family)
VWRDVFLSLLRPFRATLTQKINVIIMKLVTLHVAGLIIYATFLTFLILINLNQAKSSNGSRIGYELNIVLLVATMIPFSVFLTQLVDPYIQPAAIFTYSWIISLGVGTAITLIAYFK